MASLRLVIPLLAVLAAGPVLERPGIARSTDCLRTYDVGGSPESLAAGDLNEDGHLDVIAANRFGPSAQVWVLLGTDGGAFAAATPYDAGEAPSSVSLGDLNGDGHLDLAVVNAATSHGPTPRLETVSVLLGTGTGSFGSAVAYGVGMDTYPVSLSIGDFDRDGRLDLAVLTQADNAAAVLLGRGDGSFGPATRYRFAAMHPFSALSLAVGDVDADGHLDLIAAVAGDNSVSVLLGGGNGDFADSVAFPTGNTPVSVALSDFNEDGRVDIAVANSDDNTVSVLLGTGGGHFASATPYRVRTAPAAVAVGDLDGDGHADLAVANSFDSTLSVLLGTGTGRFGPDKAYGVGRGPASVVTGDFDKDGRSDLAVGNRYDNTVSALLTVTACVEATPRVCVGDCYSDGAVTIDELLTMVSIALGGTLPAACPAAASWVDNNTYPGFGVSDVLKGVINALYGCASCPPGTCHVSPDGSCEAPTGPVGNACCECGYDSWCASVCICASPDTPIATPTGDVPISSLRVGDLVYTTTDFGVVAVPVLKTHRQAVRAHRVVRVALATGAVLEISAGHPTADGRVFADLHVGDILGDTMIISVEVVPYAYDYTYDILPASESGVYFAGGVPVGSTLQRVVAELGVCEEIPRGFGM